MSIVVIYDHVRLAIEREIEKAIEKYPQLIEEVDDIRADMIEAYFATGEVAKVVLKSDNLAPQGVS